MENEKQEKSFRKWFITLGVLLVLFFMGLGGYLVYEFHYKEKRHNQRIEFVSKYINQQDAEILIHWSDKYDIDFIVFLSNILTESGGDRFAKGKRNRNGTRDYCYGQLNSITIKILKQMLREDLELAREVFGLKENIKDKEVLKAINTVSYYDSRFNLWGTAMWLRWILDYFGDNQYFEPDAVHYSIMCYNMGLGAWRSGKDNVNHLKKFLVRKSSLEVEWREFLKEN